MTEIDRTQLDKFKEAAREHEADEHEAHWDERLKKVAMAKPDASDKPDR
jgi:hypothetical protein